MPAAASEVATEVLEPQEKLLIDQVIGKFRDRPERSSESLKPSKPPTPTSFFPWPRWATLPTRPVFLRQESTARPPSTRSSISILRETTSSVFAAERLAIPAALATCLRRSGSISA